MNIKVKNVSKRIRGITILSDVSMNMSSGKIYGVVGQNGCGKSMLLRTIAGLIVPTEGVVEVDDKVLHKDISFPEKMGILIEVPSFLDYLSGFENLKLLATIQNIISVEEIKEYMKMFGLNPDEKKPVRKYSLGMKQKLGIIQAIMENPDLLILDEPFNALDEDSVSTLQKLVLSYKAKGKIVVVTSHHKEEINAVCDCIYQMKNGQIEEIRELLGSLEKDYI